MIWGWLRCMAYSGRKTTKQRPAEGSLGNNEHLRHDRSTKGARRRTAASKLLSLSFFGFNVGRPRMNALLFCTHHYTRKAGRSRRNHSPPPSFGAAENAAAAAAAAAVACSGAHDG